MMLHKILFMMVHVCTMYGGGGGKGGGAKAPPPPAPTTDPTAEYNKRRSELADARENDMAAHRARMAAGGMSEGSAGWAQGLASIEDTYNKKLKSLSDDPFFSQIKGSTGFGTWG